MYLLFFHCPFVLVLDEHDMPNSINGNINIRQQKGKGILPKKKGKGKF